MIKPHLLTPSAGQPPCRPNASAAGGTIAMGLRGIAVHPWFVNHALRLAAMKAILFPGKIATIQPPWKRRVSV